MNDMYYKIAKGYDLKDVVLSEQQVWKERLHGLQTRWSKRGRAETDMHALCTISCTLRDAEDQQGQF